MKLREIDFRYQINLDSNPGERKESKPQIKTLIKWMKLNAAQSIQTKIKNQFNQAGIDLIELI